MTEQAAAAWYGQLRRGSSITWAEHLAGGSAGDGTPVRVGAAHLELVRRLAARVGGRRRFAELADLVVATPAFGRGRVDIPLPLPGRPPVNGSPPMDPELVPPGELLRIGVPVLAGLLDARPAPDSTVVRSRRRRGPGVVLHGNPGMAQPLREALAAAGVREGGRSARHVVLAAPLDAAVFALWTARVRGGAAVRWRRLWERLSAADLPPGVDPAGIVDELADRIRGDRIQLVVAGSAATAAMRLGPLAEADLTVSAPFSWAEVDLARRLNWLHVARMDAAERAARVGALLDLPREQPADAGGVPGVPVRLRPWASAAAARIRDGLAERVEAGGYAVHGDLEEVGGVGGAAAGETSRIGPAATLDVAIEAIAQAFEERG